MRFFALGSSEGYENATFLKVFASEQQDVFFCRWKIHSRGSSLKCVAFCSIEILPCFCSFRFFPATCVVFSFAQKQVFGTWRVQASEACLKKAFEDLDKEVLRNQPPGLGEVVTPSHLSYQNSLLLHQLRLVVHPIYEVYISQGGAEFSSINSSSH